jgi:hypothetical protein
MIWKILNAFFVVVGVIATIIIVAGLLMYWSWGRGSFWMPGPIMMNTETQNEMVEQMGNYDHPLLSPEQEKAAASVGIDVSKLPTEISDIQRQCSIEALGEERVTEIERGATPSALDIFKARHCFE